MKLLYLYLLVAVLFSIANSSLFASSSSSSSNPDLVRNISEIIQARGYPVENHQAITPDGYILSVQRIPAGRYQNNPNPYGSNGKPAVILQHGVEDLGITWVLQENVYQSLGFILADNGFDVWINNVRGTTYSNSNINYSSDSKEFWAFSFDEMAQYDLPTVVDYVLETTGNKKVGYVGHSQGTTMAFIGMTNQTVADKINLFVALAPVVRVTHCESDLLNILSDFNVDILFAALGFNAFLPDTPFLQKYLPVICKNAPSICENSLALIMGWDEASINTTRLPVYMAHEPGGTSVQNVIHWSQATKDGYQKFDYGVVGNLAHYGQATPPQYNIRDFNVPVVVYSGGQDYLADPTDVQWLIDRLSSLVNWKSLPSYSHLDFVWGENAYIDVYGEVTQYLLKYANA
ncbi:hypothetical protein DICPUDRAFT_152935 [Dictyostelium purpureum]|uniref:Lipase n=1 Tax=Dictyostelium purpureum TaxID=5786 RepID=F0ZMM9_DICPU|nr:uncharacterized protein DICPUDRAFT_152935 [Dictyostelium purpureum]EGC34804.1 hypothetical protein DICPUDRAFT_152935 [Dictyostelium purpureum]|eukprot:XP_003288661.1 hypothetical protein DICPUDRAFT_152935 [Dictyostelium purpureum]